MSANHPLYPTREIGVYPNAYVQQEDIESCFIFITPRMGDKAYGIRIPKRDMKLLAKRLIQCFKEWEK